MGPKKSMEIWRTSYFCGWVVKNHQQVILSGDPLAWWDCGLSMVFWDSIGSGEGKGGSLPKHPFSGVKMWTISGDVGIWTHPNSLDVWDPDCFAEWNVTRVTVWLWKILCSLCHTSWPMNLSMVDENGKIKTLVVIFRLSLMMILT